MIWPCPVTVSAGFCKASSCAATAIGTMSSDRSNINLNMQASLSYRPSKRLLVSLKILNRPLSHLGWCVHG